MSKRQMGILLGVVLLLSVIVIAVLYPKRTQEVGFGCQSDTVSRKNYSTGESTALSLTTLFLFNGSDIVTVIHKGVFTRGDKRYLIDRNGNDSNLLIVFYVQIMPDDFVMQLHRF
ncbi:hypothetical protein [Enterobacter cloacae]|uniref:hypothetical protein n=1 Tax=Enterobacter cloacae TaxID=550 RepID=UPI001FF29F12|nr:hypothetical protein [Enterobacter cloacae]UOZ00084.1 hypothetical protein LCD47_00355 [Enterobacter cloacae subsp. cloacae]